MTVICRGLGTVPAVALLVAAVLLRWSPRPTVAALGMLIVSWRPVDEPAHIGHLRWLRTQPDGPG